MILTRLEIDGLRLLENVVLEPHARLNLLEGPNGSGKSSVLEAIQCLSTGHSFRSRKPRELIAREREEFIVTGRLLEREQGREHRIGLSRQRDGTLEMRVDYEAVDSVAEATRLLPVKTLSPDSHALVQEGPEERRRFLDWGVFHVEPHFLDAWRRYRRALSQRNQALRDQRPEAEVRTWDEQLADTGTLVDRYRRDYVRRLADALHSRTRRLGTSVDVTLRYRGGWSEGTTLASVLEANLARHRQLRTTADGPHRGELVIASADVPVRQTLSRGQQKVLVYLMHLAQLDLMRAHADREAVVLCDDLLSELDGDSAHGVAEQLLEVSGQVFVTGVALSGLQDGEHRLFHVQRGTVVHSEG